MQDILSQDWVNGFAKQAEAMGISDPAEVAHLMKAAQQLELERRQPGVQGAAYRAVLRKSGMDEATVEKLAQAWENQARGFWGNAGDIASLGIAPLWRRARAAINPEYKYRRIQGNKDYNDAQIMAKDRHQDIMRQKNKTMIYNQSPEHVQRQMRQKELAKSRGYELEDATSATAHQKAMQRATGAKSFNPYKPRTYPYAN